MKGTLCEHSVTGVPISVEGLASLPIFPSKPISTKNSSGAVTGSTLPKQSTNPSISPASFLQSLVHSAPLFPSKSPISTSHIPSKPRPKDVTVQCKARTRVPTPHGPIFLHIYHNNVDSKEHLAIVVDPAQLDNEDPESALASQSRFIRSKTLDAKWHDEETDIERLIRGAYVGRLSPKQATPSRPLDSSSPSSQASNPESSSALPIPIVRIHSECYTGETIGSMRCDCGEQLDEAIRYISQPQPAPITSTFTSSTSSEPQSSGDRQPRPLLPGRGAVIYMRQEGRGIGLLEKIKAYNLQDMGADTVAANILLGHGADERGYDVAAAIMRDLGLDKEIKLLTNNPAKMEAVRKEGIAVNERLPMVPRTWTAATLAAMDPSAPSGDSSSATSAQGEARKPGATLIGGGAAYGVDLEKYLRTKVLRMGHLLELPTPANPQPTHEIVVPLSEGSTTSAAFETVESPVIPLRPLS
ncbi:hypothetical protein DL93DRAFT_2063039 [Clavulina sp. PMI_390]|nr:hypothetical protein DL93DRAFT_2063039 [Clavulina sp. PMI_390]